MNKKSNFNLEGKHFKDQRKINEHHIKSINQSTNLQQAQYDNQFRVPSRNYRKQFLNLDSSRSPPIDDNFIIG